MSIAGVPRNSQPDGGQFDRQDVILVTFSYRLGRHGFFALPFLQRIADENGATPAQIALA